MLLFVQTVQKTVQEEEVSNERREPLKEQPLPSKGKPASKTVRVAKALLTDTKLTKEEVQGTRRAKLAQK